MSRALREHLVLALLGAAALSGCKPAWQSQAAELVREYDRKLVEAYRTGDARVIEGVAGPAEATRLTALIGVKLDSGINLDAHLETLEVKGASRQGDRIEVETEERWRYVDRRIGTGEPVGDPSEDRYRMVYVLERDKGHYVVSEVRFAAPPQVGRDRAYVGTDPGAMHGVERRGAPDGGAGRAP